jgi:hypothetical protein
MKRAGIAEGYIAFALGRIESVRMAAPAARERHGKSRGRASGASGRGASNSSAWSGTKTRGPSVGYRTDTGVLKTYFALGRFAGAGSPAHLTCPRRAALPRMGRVVIRRRLPQSSSASRRNADPCPFGGERQASRPPRRKASCIASMVATLTAARARRRQQSFQASAERFRNDRDLVGPSIDAH